MVLTRSPEIVRPVTPEGSDPFTDLNDENDITEQRDDKLNSLRRRLTSADFCSASEIIQAENALPVCWEYTEDNWEAEFVNEFGPHSSKQPMWMMKVKMKEVKIYVIEGRALG